MKIVDAAARHERAGLAGRHHLLKRPSVRHEARDLVRHRFQRRDAERFVQRRHHEQATAPKKVVEPGAVGGALLAQIAVEDDSGFKFGGNRQRVRADDVKRRVGERLTNRPKSAEQFPAALAREVDADEQDRARVVGLIVDGVGNRFEIDPRAHGGDALSGDVEVLNERAAKIFAHREDSGHSVIHRALVRERPVDGARTDRFRRVRAAKGLGEVAIVVGIAGRTAGGQPPAAARHTSRRSGASRLQNRRVGDCGRSRRSRRRDNRCRCGTGSARFRGRGGSSAR